MGRERGFGILSQFLNHTDTLTLGAQGLDVTAFFVALTTVAGKKVVVTVHF